MLALADCGDTSVNVYMTHRQLVNKIYPLPELIAKMLQIDGNDLLLLTSKFSITTTFDSGLYNTVYQAKLARDLLPQKTFEKYQALQMVRKCLAKRNKQAFQPSPILTPIHILNFLKIIVTQHTFAGGEIMHHELSPNTASNAFILMLAFGDHLASSQKTPSNYEAETRFVIQELVRTTLLLQKEDSHRIIGRYHKMLFEVANSLQGDSALAPLNELFYNAKGIDLATFFCIGFSLLIKFAPASLVQFSGSKDNPNEHFVLDWDNFFKAVSLSKDASDILKKLFAQTVEDARLHFQKIEHESKLAGSDTVYEYSLYPFMANPILKIDEKRYLVTYVPFLIDKFTSGVFWSIMDSLDGSRKGDFANFWGKICQKYSEAIFSDEIVPHSRIKRKMAFYDVPYKKGKQELAATDIIIFDHRKSELFLFEVTYSALRLETSFANDNLAALSEGVDKVVGKVRQMDAVIKDLKNGAIELPGIDVTKIRIYRPFVVSLNPYPCWNFIWTSYPNVWKGLTERLNEHSLLASADIAQVRLMTIAELEVLGALQRSNIDIFQVLPLWSNDQRWGTEPLRNFLHKFHRAKGNTFKSDDQLKQVQNMVSTVLLPTKMKDVNISNSQL